MLFTAIGASGYFNARARFLLPAFALLLPPAIALAKTRSSRAYVVIGTLAVISAYIGCYLILHLEVLALARRRSRPPPWTGSRPAPVAGPPSGASRGVRR